MNREDNIINFSFNRCIFEPFEGSSDRIISHYQDVFLKYFRLIKVENSNSFELEKINLSTCIVNEDEGIKHSNTTNILRILMPFTNNFLINGKINNQKIFSFFIYGQNNCCGAMTTSKTFVNGDLRDKKLATILQYLKEDLAIFNKISLLTCTDIYYKNVNENTDINTLKPYLPNTKVLLNTGWEITTLFYNKNSKNVVGLFTKKLKTNSEIKKQIDMKIVVDNEKIVKIENPTIGCDPEAFFKKQDSDEYIPSFYVMKGDKNNPTQITDDGHNIQCDNVMVEYGVPPSKTAEEFVNNNLLVQNYIKDKIAKPNNLELVIFPAASFKDIHINTKKAQEFGCDPDFNVWKGGQPNTVGSSKDGLRTAGGHIHIGYSNYNRATNNYLIKALDLFVSMPLVLMEPDNRRKEMYGNAGSYREQPWGIEYRSTSNYIFSSPELMKWAFNQVLKAIDFVNDEKKRQDLDYYGSKIELSINNKNKVNAQWFIEKYEINILTPEKVTA